ncbi:phytoene/squalene synthase family protein [Rubrobacter aplysinae]|uniref:phytoene/squalene synthase family protein n=1 Tax=Rubrobacter aplysinae TaxID=909625 RepID=UPI00069F5330|nr:phytoene/squalene synthase family protein [Rubrobacter aplysinae]
MRVGPSGDGTPGGELLSLPECYERCRRVERYHSRTYYFSTQLFPREVRPHVHAIYAFMREADEIVDDPGEASLEEQLAGLDGFEAETVAAISGESVANPTLRAFANTVRLHGIELDTVNAFLGSMKMDTRVFRYETFMDLKSYTYGSAAVVGLMMCRIMGVTDAAADPHAEALGEAMQLTNFLRDVGEDWERGRVYLPQEDLKHFEYTEKDLASGVIDERFAKLMRFEISRARRLYEDADRGLHYIPRGRRYPIAVARRLYAAILDSIEANGYDVFSGKASTSAAKKLAVATGCAARDPKDLVARSRSRRAPGTAIPA